MKIRWDFWLQRELEKDDIRKNRLKKEEKKKQKGTSKAETDLRDMSYDMINM